MNNIENKLHRIGEIKFNLRKECDFLTLKINGTRVYLEAISISDTQAIFAEL